MIVPVDKALSNNVVLLAGEEEYPRHKALRAILAAVAPEGNDFDLQTFDADASSPADWLASASTSPFLSEKRTVVVRHILRTDPPEDLFGKGCAKLKSLPPYAFLVFVADDEQGDDIKQRRLKAQRASWETAISKAKGFVYAFKGDAKALQTAIREEVEERGCKITAKALDALQEMTGGSLSRALDEIDKLTLFATDSTIREADVNQVVFASREWNVFKMADAIFAGSAKQAVSHLRILLEGSSKPEDVAFGTIFPQTMNQLRLLWQARVCIDRRVSPTDVPAELLKAFPEKPNLANEAEWKQRRVMQTARKLALGQIADCMQIVADTDAALKGLLPSFNSQEALEQMVLRMIEAVGPSR